MHCDVFEPALPIAGFLIVFGITLLVGQRRGPRSRVRLGLGIGCLLLAIAAALTVTTTSVGCEPLPPPVPGRSAIPPTHGWGAG